jgi:phage terminase large subunit-like protein
MSQLSCSEFAQHALGLTLGPKQLDIVNNLFEDNITHGVWCLGRRSGKTLLAAVSAVYMCFVLDEYFTKRVRKGEKWYIETIANDLQQAKIALDNIRQLIVNSPFAQEIVRETAFELEISNHCIFQAIPASARASRGKAVACAIFDEVAFSLDTDANRGARALFDATEVDELIPIEYYKAVAEIISYVMKIRPGTKLAKGVAQDRNKK